MINYSDSTCVIMGKGIYTLSTFAITKKQQQPKVRGKSV